MRIYVFVLIAILSLNMLELRAQGPIALTEMRIGEKCPDLELTSIINFSRPAANIADFKGKLLILDFWTTWCMPCIAGFPKLDSLQKQFKDQIQILGVGEESKNTLVDFFKKRNVALHIQSNFPTTTDDSLLSSYFKHIYVPHFIWINPEGVIVAITDKDKVNASNIKAFLEGKSIQLTNKIDLKLVGFKYEQPLLLNGNGTSDSLVLHSILTGYMPGLGGMDLIYDKRLLVLNYSKLGLFMLAYGGNKANLGFSPSVGFPKNRVIMNFRDTLLDFEFPKGDIDVLREWQKRNTYCYDVILPGYSSKLRRDPTPQDELYLIMQKDLSNAFSLKASIETRKVKCLVLTRSSKVDKIKSKGGKPAYDMTAYSLHIQNSTLDNFTYQLRNILLQLDPRPFIDETQYSSNVDIDINVKLSDPAALSVELKKIGLELIEAERNIEMLVVTDK